MQQMAEPQREEPFESSSPVQVESKKATRMEPATIFKEFEAFYKIEKNLSRAVIKSLVKTTSSSPGTFFSNFWPDDNSETTIKGLMAQVQTNINHLCACLRQSSAIKFKNIVSVKALCDIFGRVLQKHLNLEENTDIESIKKSLSTIEDPLLTLINSATSNIAELAIKYIRNPSVRQQTKLMTNFER